ncbi:MAG TPA: class II aldolase/adducin family protein [Burkholderiaceae bacterium]|nr:class II aldolase/adducin family protein [Burkholderiaceae bacterium]
MSRSGQIDDVVDANHVLFDQGIVDAFGHVSVRCEDDASRFLMARNVAPSRVTAADILEYHAASGEPVASAAPRLYLERFIHSEIYRARPDVMAVVHNHSPAVLPFAIARGGAARFVPVCHMAGFLGGKGHESVPRFEIRDHAGEASDLLIRSRELGTALARTLGERRLVLMRGHGCTVVGPSLPVAVFRAVYTELNAKLLLQTLPLGEIEALTAGEADATRITNEAQVARPWDLWREQAQHKRGRLAG